MHGLRPCIRQKRPVDPCEGFSRRPHQLGHAEGEVERLARIQTRVTERHVARVELRLLYILRAAEALRDVVPRELEMDAARPRAGLPMRREESFDLAEDRIEVPCLPSGRAGEHV